MGKEYFVKRFLQLFILAIAFSSMYFSIKADDELYLTSGKDFWLTFLPNHHSDLAWDTAAGRNSDSVYIIILADQPCSGKIEYRDSLGNLYTQDISITDPTKEYYFHASFYEFELGSYYNGRAIYGKYEQFQCERIAKQSFHVTSDNDIYVYAFSNGGSHLAAFNVIPTNLLYKNHFVMSYNSGEYPLFATPSEFAVVATEDKTYIEIKPTAPTEYNGLKTQKITLNRGDVYMVQAETDIRRQNKNKYDLTGTYIYSNKPVVVFSGNQCTYIPKEQDTLAFSNLIQEVPDMRYWGKNAFIVPFPLDFTKGTPGNDIFRVLAGFDSTEVFVNGAKKANINKGEFYEDTIIDASLVTASNPVLVSEYKRSYKFPYQFQAGTVNYSGSPFMLIIPPIEHFYNSYKIINAQLRKDVLPTYPMIRYQYLTIVAPTSSFNFLRIDSLQIADTLIHPIANTDYSYSIIPDSTGVHNIKGTESFACYVHGYTSNKSYGYCAGGNYIPISGPHILKTIDCFTLGGVVIDSSISLPVLNSVKLIKNSINNVSLTINPFSAPADSVEFTASLRDTTKDGYFTLEATDTLGYYSKKKIFIPGYTLALNYFESKTSPTLNFYVPSDSLFSIMLPVHNYGDSAHIISLIEHSNSKFNYYFNIPWKINANSFDSLRLTFQSKDEGIYTDTITISTDCGSKILAIIKVHIPDSIYCGPSYFDFPWFDYNNKLSLNGAAFYENNKLRMTSARSNLNSSAWFSIPIPISKGFTTNFSFKITDGDNNHSYEKSITGADGIAFVIQNFSPMALGGTGGGISYDGIPNSLAVEFDTFNDDTTQIINLLDPNGNHIAVQSLGTASNSSRHEPISNLGMSKNIMPIKGDGKVYYAKIEYLMNPDEMSVYLDTNPKLLLPVLAVQKLNLSILLNLTGGNEAWVGFTAATGTAYENHYILSWSFCPSSNEISGVEFDNIPKESSLNVFPNPIRTDAQIEFDNPKNGNVSIRIINVLGEEINVIINEYLESGHYKYKFPVDNLLQGIYYFKYTNSENQIIKSIIVIRQ